jgi:hypothetical protein
MNPENSNQTRSILIPSFTPHPSNRSAFDNDYHDTHGQSPIAHQSIYIDIDIDIDNKNKDEDKR